MLGIKENEIIKKFKIFAFLCNSVKNFGKLNEPRKPYFRVFLFYQDHLSFQLIIFFSQM